MSSLLPSLRLFLAGALLACGTSLVAGAQTASVIASPRPDSTRHRLSLDPTRVRARRFTYRVSLTRDSISSYLSELQVQIGETQYAGMPAWVVSHVGGTATNSIDSLTVSHSELRPLHWSAVQGAARLAVELTPDTIFGAMTSPLGKQNILLPNRGDLLVNAAIVDVVLSTLSLNREWRDSASVLVVDPGGATVVPAALTVEGEERIVVPSGEYDCWVVSLETERGAARYWVSKDDPVVVRSEQQLPQLGGAVLVRELTMLDALTPAPTPPTERRW